MLLILQLIPRIESYFDSFFTHAIPYNLLVCRWKYQGEKLFSATNGQVIANYWYLRVFINDIITKDR